MEEIFKDHPWLFLAFKLAGGTALLWGLAAGGLPKITGWLVRFLLSKPIIRRQLIIHEAQILEAIDKAQEEFKKEVDAAAVIDNGKANEPKR